MTLLRSMVGAAAVGALLVAGNGFAQTSGSAPTATPDEQNAPQHFDSQTRKNGDRSLSERLDRSDGVIKPPTHVDRGMLQDPPPSADSEMAIKPPADSQVKPKQ